MHEIGVIILNWRRPEYTNRCLNSIAQSEYPNLTICVIDNHSADGSVEKIQTASPSINVVEAVENLGYAGGNNLGIKRLLEQKIEYFFLLNDDITIEKDTIHTLAQAAEENPSAGFLGPLIYSLENPGAIISAGGQLSFNYNAAHRGLGDADVGQYTRNEVVDFLSGSALLVKRQLVEQIGGLDERFFLYFEEVDWCLRGRQAGFQCMLVPGAHAYHPDTRIRDEYSASLTYYSSRNRLLLAQKHHAGFAALLAIAAGSLRQLLSWTLRPKWRGKSEQRKALASALLDFARQKFGKWER